MLPVILGLVALFKGGETPNWGAAIGVAIAVGFGMFALINFLGQSMGIFSMLPMALIAGVVLWIACDIPIKRAMIAGGILFVYKVAIIFLMVEIYT